MRAFRETLPSQQALGQLFGAVSHLGGRADEDRRQLEEVRQLAASLSNALSACTTRSDDAVQDVRQLAEKLSTLAGQHQVF